MAVLDDDWRVQRKVPFRAFAVGDGTGARHNYGIFRDYERLLIGSTVDLAADQIVNRRGARQDGPNAQHSACPYLRAFIDSTVSADQAFFFDYNRRSPANLHHPPNLPAI